MTLFNKNQNFNIEKARILSDNYEVFLEYNDVNGKLVSINLNDNALKSFSWKSRDEIKIWKPCTKLEEIVHVKMLGFDIDLSFAKNSTEIATLYFDQHMKYYNQALSIDSGSNTTRNLGKFNRTYENEYKSNFQGLGNGSAYNVPTYDLRVKIQHYLSQDATQVMYEEIVFKTVKFYGMEESTSENSSEIEQKIKAFSSYSTRKGNSDFDRYLIKNDRMFNLAGDQLEKLLNPTSTQLDYSDRKIRSLKQRGFGTKGMR